MSRPREGLKYSPSETAVYTTVSELEVYGEVGQLAPAVSDRGYARYFLTVAAWTPRAAPAAARRRHGCLHLVMIVHSCEYTNARYDHSLVSIRALFSCNDPLTSYSHLLSKRVLYLLKTMEVPTRVYLELAKGTVSLDQERQHELMFPLLMVFG